MRIGVELFIASLLLLAAAFVLRSSRFASGVTFYQPLATYYIPLNAILFWILVAAAGVLLILFVRRGLAKR